MEATQPTLKDWLSFSASQVHTSVADRKLAVLFSIDGTQRYYLLKNPTTNGQITDFEDYAAFSAKAYATIFEMFFSLGIKTLLCPILIENNFWRGEKYIAKSLEMFQTFFLHRPMTELYQKLNLKVRLYGDYAFAPAAQPFQSQIETLEKGLEELTPDGEQTLLLGIYGGSLTDEIITRSAQLYSSLERVPSEKELRATWFPDGPERLHLFINSGWLIGAGLIPAIFANNAVDLYTLNTLALDMPELTLRHILYDHLFRRHAAPYDDTKYSEENIKEFAQYYTAHRDCVVGLGHLIGPNLWYPDHPEIEANNVPNNKFTRLEVINVHE